MEFHTKSKYDEHVRCQWDLVIDVCYVRSTNATVVGCDNGLKLRNVLKEIRKKRALVLGDFNYLDIDWTAYSVTSTSNSDTYEFLETV